MTAAPYAAATPAPVIGLPDIAKHFEALPDPRSSINRKFLLADVLVCAILGVLAGCSGPTAIAVWADAKHDLLQRGLNFPKGVPCKDVFRQVLTLIDPRQFQACFRSWLKSLLDQGLADRGLDELNLAIDGKTVRRSHDRKNGLGALHSVSVWATELGLTLGQVACAEKSNEITAIPEVLKLLDLHGVVVTIDAMGTQKEIAKQIVDGGGDYVLALKGNQPGLEKEVLDLLEPHVDDDFAGLGAQVHTVTEKAHGQTETRTYVQIPVPPDFAKKADWAGLQTIGLATRHYEKNGEPHSDLRLFISSLELGVKRFSTAARGHWSIENTCHWSLDFTFREDESRIRDPNHRENFAWLNRLALSLLKQHPSRDSIVMKRRLCGWDDNFLVEVLTGQTT